MSIAVTLDELGETLARFRYAFLVTVGDGGAHVLAVSPDYRDGALIVSAPGRRTLANLQTRAELTLVWPPADPSEHSLIVDGTGAAHEDTLVITPGKAVLHRPAPPPAS